MPFRSKSQIRRFQELVRSGEITQEKFDEWMRSTPSPKKLPERVAKAPAGMIKALKPIKPKK